MRCASSLEKLTPFPMGISIYVCGALRLHDTHAHIKNIFVLFRKCFLNCFAIVNTAVHTRGWSLRKRFEYATHFFFQISFIDIK